MMVVGVEYDPVLTFGPPRKLFDGQPYGRAYDLHPDGDRFLMVKQDEAEELPTPPQRIHVVLNWIEELKERVPVP